MWEKLLVNCIKWVENTSQFNEDFAKNYKEDSDKRCFVEVDGQYSEELHELHNDLLFLPEKMII